jgi:hypothetical protein
VKVHDFEVSSLIIWPQLDERVRESIPSSKAYPHDKYPYRDIIVVLNTYHSTKCQLLCQALSTLTFAEVFDHTHLSKCIAKSFITKDISAGIQHPKILSGAAGTYSVLFPCS